MLFCPYSRAVWYDVKEDYDLHLNHKGFTSLKTWLFDFLERGGDIPATFWRSLAGTYGTKGISFVKKIVPSLRHEWPPESKHTLI
jgi:hypothetical protein